MSKRHPANHQAKPSRSRFPLWPVVAVVVVVLAIAVMVVAVMTQNNTAVQAYPLEITVQEAAASQAKGAFILDVRQPEEWAQFHMANATLIPLGELPARLAEVPRDKDVIVVCRSGNRSQSGRDILLKAGFTRVTSMAGGLTKWQAAGLPVSTGS